MFRRPAQAKKNRRSYIACFSTSPPNPMSCRRIPIPLVHVAHQFSCQCGDRTPWIDHVGELDEPDPELIIGGISVCGRPNSRRHGVLFFWFFFSRSDPSAQNVVWQLCRIRYQKTESPGMRQAGCSAHARDPCAWCDMQVALTPYVHIYGRCVSHSSNCRCEALRGMILTTGTQNTA